MPQLPRALYQNALRYHAAMSCVAGGAKAGLLLCYYMHWSETSYRKHPEDDKAWWFWRTVDATAADTGLSRTEQQAARKQLHDRGLLQCRRAAANFRMWYWLDWHVLVDQFEKYFNEDEANRKQRIVSRPPWALPGYEEPAPKKSPIARKSLPALVTELVAQGVSQSTAERLAGDFTKEQICAQIAYLPYREAKEPAAALVRAIQSNWAAPKAYEERQKTRKVEATKAEYSQKRRADEEATKQQVADAWAALSAEDRATIEKEARGKLGLKSYDKPHQQEMLKGVCHSVLAEQLGIDLPA